jgi:cytochrome oxidase assembly protein ShyY1
MAVSAILGGVRFLLRPGWIALTIAVAGFAFACYYLLAPWQFHRSDERDGANAAVDRAVTDAPVPRASLVPGGAAPSADDEWRPVTVRGIYLPGDVLVRLRSVDGEAATEVVTALRSDDGPTLLVDRGYVRPAVDGSLPPIAPAPPGPVTLTAYQRLDEPLPRRPTVSEGGYRQVYAMGAPTVGPVLGVPLAPGYLQLVGGQPGVLTPVPLPPPDPNSSYSYAWQWLLFGLMAVGAWVHFARLEYLREHGDRADATGSDEPRRARRRVDPRDRPDGTYWDAADRTDDVRSGSEL